MRMGIRWFLLIAGLLVNATAAFAQGMDVSPVLFTGPFSNPRPEGGGLYVGASGVYMNTNRTIGSQQVAIRGFKDLDGATGVNPGTFVGTGEEALNTSQLRGPGQDQPGYDLFFGWKFEGGVAVELAWRHLTPVSYHAGASIIPPNFNTEPFFANTFLFAPVSNFTTEWAGAQPTLPPPATQATTFGIWNGASSMTIDFIQKYDIYQINVRVPIWETADHRTYGLFGPRIVWIFERFDWRTVSVDNQGNFGPESIAVYSNTVSNRMYGVHFGGGNDWFLGSTPIGGFAFNLDIEGGLYIDLVKTTANYDRGDGLVSAGRSGRLNALSPGFEIRAGLKWYVWEGITIEAGYDIQTYFNTLASVKPIDFNLGSVDPQYDHIFFRWYHGMRLGISFSF